MRSKFLKKIGTLLHLKYLKNILSHLIGLHPPGAQSELTYSLTPKFPTKIAMDSSSVCQLACPLCPTGTKSIELKKSFLLPDSFQIFLSKFPRLDFLWLHNWGEPFLNPRIFELLEMTKQKNIQTSLDTNFSLPMDDTYLKKILASGLGTLRISLDGASKKTYDVYRKNGNFSMVFGNMKRLRELQKQTNATTPKIFWKFLVHKHNEHEIAKARKMAKEVDVELMFDYFQLSEDILDVKVSPEMSLNERKEYWLPKQKKYTSAYYTKKSNKPPYIDTVCPWLFSSMVVHPDGNVLPCCYVASEKSSMGNLHTQSLEEIWHSDKYQYARSLFMPDARVKRVSVICERCPIYTYARKNTVSSPVVKTGI